MGGGLALLNHQPPERAIQMFRTAAEKTPRGDYNVATTCAKGHTGYRKATSPGEWKCPYCGLTMP